MLLLISSVVIEAQVIFSETFDEPDGTTIGTDNSGNNINWSSSCGTCVSGDWWEVRNGVFEGTDTNGPASWTSGAINTSSCSQIEISFDLAENGTLEGCGTGCNSVDWVQLQYRIDAGPWQSPSNSFNCAGSCAGIDVIQADDIAGGSMSYSSGCIPTGNNLEIRITVQTWAASEQWQIDNVQVNCSNSNPGSDGQAQLCENASSIDLFDYLGGAPAAGGSWSGPSVLSNGGQGTYTPGNNTPGTYTYTVGPVGCQSSAEVVVTEWSAPTPSIANFTDPSCGQNNGEIEVGISGGTAPIEYSINGITYQSSNIFSNVSAGNYNITVEDDNGCTGSVGVVLNNLAGPVIDNVIITDPTCGNPNGEIEIQVSGGSAPYQYSIDNGGSFQSNNVFNSLLPDTYPIVVVDDNACQETTSVDLVSSPPPSFTVSGVDPSCQGNDGEITISGLDPNSNYGLTYDMDGSQVGPNNETSDAAGDILISGLNNGVYTDFSIVTANGCTEIDNTVINLVSPATHTVDAGSDQSVCEGDQITLTAGNPDGATISWNNGVTDGQSFTIQNTTIFTVSADLNGCIITDQVEVTVNPLPVINPIADVQICNDAMLNSISFSSDIPNTTYDWSVQSGNDFGAGVSGTGNFPGVNQSLGQNFQETIIVTPTSPEGCVGQSDQFTISTYSGPAVSFTADVISGCEPLVVTFTNNTQNSQNCTWDFGDGSTEIGCQSIVHTFPEGLFDISLTVEDQNGCSTTETYVDFIDVIDRPIADFQWSPESVTVEDTEVEFYNYSSGATDYEWIIGNLGDTLISTNITFTFPEVPDATYPVTLVANNGTCDDQITHNITIQDILLFYVPNAFTPDGDGHNQYFKPIMTSGFDPYDYHLIIFNRWGEPVFESYNALVGWDGTYDGKNAQDGVYIWRIEFKRKYLDDRETHTGHVNLLR